MASEPVDSGLRVPNPLTFVIGVTEPIVKSILSHDLAAWSEGQGYETPEYSDFIKKLREAFPEVASEFYDWRNP